jgi:hypothetical protein
MKVGETVYAAADQVDYIPLPRKPRKEAIDGASGEDWYRFHFAGAPKLVFFQIELESSARINSPTAAGYAGREVDRI